MVRYRREILELYIRHWIWKKVFIVSQTLDEIVALKRIVFNSKNKKARAVIDREINILSQINHPNVIRLLDYKIKETKATLVFEYCEFDLMYIIENTIYPIDNNLVIFKLSKV